MIIEKSLTILGDGSKTKAGVWTQIPNPVYVILPDGYTQLEYIESNGMQLIQLIGQNTGDFWYEII